MGTKVDFIDPCREISSFVFDPFFKAAGENQRVQWAAAVQSSETQFLI